MTCGSVYRAPRESNAVFVASGVGLVVSLRPHETAPARLQDAASTPGLIGRNLEMCENGLHGVFTDDMEGWDAKFQLHRQCFTFVDLLALQSFLANYRCVSRF